MFYRNWLFAVACLAIGRPAPAQEHAPTLPPDVVASVNGVNIRKSAVSELLWREYGPVQTSFAIRSEIVRKEAERRGLIVTPAELEDRMAEYQMMFSAMPGRQPRDWDLFIQRFGVKYVQDRQIDELLSEKIGALEQAETALTDAETARVMEDLRRASERVRARLVLAGVGAGYDGRTEEQGEARARKALESLAAGASWEDVVHEYSDDVSTRERGGDLGVFTRDQMQPALEEAAFAAKPNDAPRLIRVPEGWAVLQVTERRTEPPTEEQIKAALEEALTRKKQIVGTVEYWYPIAEKRHKVVTQMPYDRP